MNEPLFGLDALDEAFLAAAQDKAVQLSELLSDSQESSHEFSEEYQEKMRRMLQEAAPDIPGRSPGRKRRHCLRAASVLLALCLGLSITVTQVEAVRQPLAKYFMKMTGQYTSITFEDNVGAKGIPDDVQQLLPTQLPKGFSVSELWAEDWFLSATFENESGVSVSYTCMPTGGSTAFDTEDCVFYQTEIGPRQAYVSIKQTFHNVLIVMFDNDYTYILSGPLSEKEALYIMETVP